MIRNSIDLLKINGVDVRTAKHEDVVKILTSCTNKVSLVAYRERVINKKMIPMSQINGSIGGQIKTVGESTKVRFWSWMYMFQGNISKWTIKTVETLWIMFKVNNKKHQNDVNDVVLVFLLLTLNIFHTFF